MGVVIVGLLGVLWAWILVPGAVRERRASSPQATVSGFQRSMALLGRTRAGRAAPSGRRVDGHTVDRRSMARRRRQVLQTLTSLTSVSLVATWVYGGVAVVALWTTTTLLVAYLGALAHRWVRVSRMRAAPLLRSPALETAAIAARTDRWQAARHDGLALQEVDVLAVDAGPQPQPVRLVRW